MKKILLCAVCISVLQALNAEQLTVSYVDGFLFLKSGSSWEELLIGDSVPDTATVKLDAQSQAELTSKTAKLLLTKAGTYQLQTLMKSARDVKQSGLGSLVSSKLKIMGSEQKVAVPSTTAGVRADVVQFDESIWVTGDSAEYIRDGKEFLKNGRYEDAFHTFAEGYDMAVDADEEAEFTFYMGYSQMLAGNPLKALALLTPVKPQRDSDYYTDYYMVTGNLLIEALAFDEAANLLSGYDPDAKTRTDESYQTISYLEGYAYKMMGDTERARKAFTRSYTLGKDTDIGKEAVRLIQE
jgi:tetratricopeptide (TPR) repeat protein